MVGVDDVVELLLARGVLLPALVIDRGVEAREVSRRNVNLRVSFLGGGGGGFFVKQANGEETSSGETLRHEAAFYAACREDDIAVHLPALVDKFDDLLVMTLLDGRGGSDLFAAELAGEASAAALGHAIGSALRGVHDALARSAALAPVLGAWSAQFPWILALHRPTPNRLPSLSHANVHLIRTLQRQPRAMATLEALARTWRSTQPIHADIKADNLLGMQRDGRLVIEIVDWELVQRGDPLWDIGGVFQELLLLWVSSMPMGGPAIDELVSTATVPLLSIGAAARATWSAYGLADEIGECVDRAMCFTGARLLQSVFERGRDAETMSNHALALLQLAVNLLERPQAAAASLFTPGLS